MDPTDQSDQPMADAPVAARDSASANSAQGGMRGQAALPPGIRQGKVTYTRTYTKQYQWRIFNQLAEYRTPTLGGTVYNGFIPPYHDVPCDLLAFYLNNAEMQRLRTKTKVRGLDYKVSVANHTAIITYETNASGTQIGNNNLGVTMCVMDPSIHKYRTGRALQPNQNDLVNNICWGVDANSLPTSNTTSSALQGLSSLYITRNFSNRYEYLTPRAIGTRTHNGQAATIVPMQFFNVNRFIAKRVNVSMQEGVIAEWSHTPKDGLLFGRFDNVYPKGGFTTNAFVDGHQPIAVRALVGDSTNMQNQVSGAAPTTVFNIVGNFYNDIFVNENDMTRISIENQFVNGHNVGVKPDVLTLGLEPQIAINNGTDAAVAIPLHVDLIVTAMCTLEITEGTDYDEANYGRLEEAEWKFPSYRTYRADGLSSEPSVVQNSLHQELGNFHETAFNTTSTNRTVPTTWNWPNATGASQAENDKTYLANLKELEKEHAEYYPYMTRAAKKKLEEQEKERLKAKEKVIEMQNDQRTFDNKVKKKTLNDDYYTDEENLN